MDAQPPRKRHKRELAESHLARLINLKIKCDMSKRQLREVLQLFHPEETAFLEKMSARELQSKQVSNG